jgi:hypothetical protein
MNRHFLISSVTDTINIFHAAAGHHGQSVCEAVAVMISPGNRRVGRVVGCALTATLRAGPLPFFGALRSPP